MAISEAVRETDAINGGAPVGRWGVYFSATRAYSFPASVASVLLGAALAYRGYGGEARFDIVMLLLTLAGAILAHAAGNIFNDYFDYVKGIDTKPEHGSGVLPSELLTVSEMRNFGTACLCGAALFGGIALLRAPFALNVIVPLGILGAACAIFYTSFLKKIALGDVTIMTAFGMGLTLGSYGVQTSVTNAPQVGLILWLALPVTLLVDAILHANNIRDAANDTAFGYRTVASLLGNKSSRNLQRILIFGPIALISLLVSMRWLPLSALAVLLSVPLLIRAYKSGDVPMTAQAHLLFGLLYALGVAVMARPI